MKLFTVTVEFDFVMVANSQADAEAEAFQYVNEAINDLSYHDMFYSAKPGVHAIGWDDDCIPYGAEDESRIRDYK